MCNFIKFTQANVHRQAILGQLKLKCYYSSEGWNSLILASSYISSLPSHWPQVCAPEAHNGREGETTHPLGSQGCQGPLKRRQGTVNLTPQQHAHITAFILMRNVFSHSSCGQTTLKQAGAWEGSEDQGDTTLTPQSIKEN